MTVRDRAGTTAGGVRLNQLTAAVIGAVLVLVGLAGFFVSSDHDAIGQDGGELLGLFQVNVLHNLVHLAVGAVMVAAAILGRWAAKTVNLAIGLVYVLLFVIGLFIIDTGGNIIALNSADNVLHAALGVVLIGVGAAADRRT
ncbi:MAG: DUF4383 domain-containing protein [Natronosporangium sp.]